MGRVTHEIWTFCKAQLTAQVATLADFALSFLLAEVAGIYYVVATFLGAVCGGIVNCYMNYRWVFDAVGLRRRNIARKYLLVWCGSIGLNTLGTYALTELSQRHFIIAKAVVAVIVGVLWNYQLQRRFVYKETHVMQSVSKKINRK